MVNKMSTISENELIEKYKSLIKEYHKKTGEFPSQIHLIAEGCSQYQAVIFELRKQIY